MQCLYQVLFFYLIYLTNAGPALKMIKMRKCIVNGTTYKHGQTVSSRDPNCHCLCVADEIYCWWENYNKSRQMILSNALTDVSNEIQLSQPVFVNGSEINKQGNANSNIKAGVTIINNIFTPLPHVTCFIMGKEYQVGEILPHSTGNCVECSCGREGRVECWPRNCIALKPPDISVLVVSANLDHENFENQIELVGTSRERGIDENF